MPRPRRPCRLAAGAQLEIGDFSVEPRAIQAGGLGACLVGSGESELSGQRLWLWTRGVGDAEPPASRRLAEMSQLLQQVHQAIQVLYRGSNPAEQQQANRWLMDFSGSQEAWEVAGQLLSSDSAEARYYGANLFFIKGNNDWATLPLESRVSLRSNLLNYLKITAGMGPSPVSMRLAHALASISLRTTRGCTKLLEETMQMASISPGVFLEILCVLPEQAEQANLAYSQREQVKDELREASTGVLRVLGSLLSSVVENSDAGRANKVLECLLVWQDVGVTLGQLFSLGVLNICIQSLQKCPAILPKLSLVLSEALEAKQESSEERNRAVLMVGEALVQLRAVFDQQARQGGSNDVCRAIAQMCSRLCENEVDLVVEGSALALQILELQLACCSHSDKRIVEDSLEFFSRVNDRPVASRAPAFGPQLFIRFLQALIPSTMYSSSFVDWNTHAPGFYFDGDQDSFEHFRQTLEDSLITCFFMLGEQYFELLLSALQDQNAQWNVCEGLLFSLAAVAPEVREMLEDGEATTPKYVAIDKCLSGVFNLVINDSRLQKHRLLSTVCCHVFGCYGFWIKQHPELIQHSIGYFLGVATETDRAGACFNRLCREAKTIFTSSPSTVESVLQVVYGDRRLANCSLANKRMFFGGLSYLVSELHVQDGPGCADVAVSCMNAILKPILQTLDSATTAANNRAAMGDVYRVILDQLSLIISIFNEQHKIQSRPRGGARRQPGNKQAEQTPVQRPHPGLPILTEKWSLICSSIYICPERPDVATLLCEVFEAALLSLGRQSTPLVAGIISTITHAFSCTHLACCVDVLALCTSTFGSQPDAAQSFQAAFSNMYRSLLQNQPAREDPGVLAAVCKFCVEMVKECPQAMLPALDPTLDLATMCLTVTQDRACLRACLDYLKAVIIWKDCPAEIKSHGLQVLFGRAPGLVRALVHAVAGDCVPRDLMTKMGGLLFAIMKVSVENFRQWFFDALASLPLTANSLKDEDKSLLLKVVCGMHDQPEVSYPLPTTPTPRMSPCSLCTSSKLFIRTFICLFPSFSVDMFAACANFCAHSTLYPIIRADSVP